MITILGVYRVTCEGGEGEENHGIFVGEARGHCIACKFYFPSILQFCFVLGEKNCLY